MAKNEYNANQNAAQNKTSNANNDKAQNKTSNASKNANNASGGSNCKDSMGNKY